MLLAESGAGGVGWSVWGLVLTAAAVSWAGGTLWASRAPSGTDPRADLMRRAQG